MRTRLAQSEALRCPGVATPPIAELRSAPAAVCATRDTGRDPLTRPAPADKNGGAVVTG